MLTKAELPVTASGHELAVVNSAAYARGRKVADVPIELKMADVLACRRHFRVSRRSFVGGMWMVEKPISE